MGLKMKHSQHEMVKWGRGNNFPTYKNELVSSGNKYLYFYKQILFGDGSSTICLLSYFELLLQWWQINRSVTENNLFPFPLLAFYCPTKMPWSISWLYSFRQNPCCWCSNCLQTIHLFVTCPLCSFDIKEHLSLLFYFAFSPPVEVDGFIFLAFPFLQLCSFKWLSSYSLISECLTTMESHIFTDSTHKSSSNSAAKLLWIH